MMFSAYGVNRGAEYLPTFSLPERMSPVECIRCYPNWRPAVEMACKTMGSVQMGGRHVGCGLLVGDGIVLVPLHLLVHSAQPVQGRELQALLSNFSISFARVGEYAPVTFAVNGVLEHNPEHDFCLLRLHNYDAFCQHPVIAYSTPHQSLLAQFNERGELIMSIVQSCPPGLWESGYCSYSPTAAGSSGGCHFDPAGGIISQHLSRSRGVCGLDSGNERRSVLAKDMVQRSNILANLQNVCLASAHLPVCTVLYLPELDTICFQEEKGGVNKKNVQHGLFICYYKELFHGTQRAISMQIQLGKHTIAMARYEIKFLQNGIRPSNIHESGVYSDKETGFYKRIAQGFIQMVISDPQNRNPDIEIPRGFDFPYADKWFRASIEERS